VECFLKTRLGVLHQRTAIFTLWACIRMPCYLLLHIHILNLECTLSFAYSLVHTFWWRFCYLNLALWPLLQMHRVGQNHAYIRYFWQENRRTYGHIRCLYMVLDNPINAQSTGGAFHWGAGMLENKSASDEQSRYLDGWQLVGRLL